MDNSSPNLRRIDRVIRGAFYTLALCLPFSITGAEGALVLLTAALIARAVVTRRWRPRFGAPEWLLLAFLGWVALAAPLSSRPDLAVARLPRYWIWLTYFVTAAAIRDRETARRGTILLMLTAGAVAIYGIAQHVFGNAVPRFLMPPVDLWQKTGGYYHAVGFFDHHLTYGNSLAVILMVGLGAVLAERGRRRLILAAALALGLPALLWSYARSAWVGLLAGLLAFGALLGKRVMALVVIGALLVGFAAQQLSPTLADRLRRSVQSESNLERIYTWKTTLQMIRDHPVFGIGSGAYRELADEYRRDYNIHWTAKSHAHNSYLQYAAESGVLAGLLFAAFLVALIALGAARFYELKDRADTGYRLAAATAGVIGFAAASLLQHNAGDAEVAMLFQFVAALLIFYVRDGRDAASGRDAGTK
ncbi:MAG: hypothetical protein GX444_16695 [Myxococcales bacterium]|nr:hypothetical protein [Myxococcales bacterium]